MHPRLHIPDGFLAPQVALALWLVTAIVVGVALRRLAAAPGAPRPVLMGLAGAFVFAAQMFNFPVAAGTSGHLLGGVLVGYLLGPWAGTLVMVTVVGIQALLFQDGGLLALGANAFNMGIIGTLGGAAIARAIGEALGGGRRAALAAVGAAAWLSVMAAAGLTTLQLGLSGTTDISIGLPAMLGTHALIGIGEALITVAAVGFIAASAPDIYAAGAAPTRVSLRRRIAAGVGVTAAIVALASLFASASPDGLEKIAADLGFLDSAQRPLFDIFADYTIPGLEGPLSTIVAGLVGVAAVLLLLAALGRIARGRSGSR